MRKFPIVERRLLEHRLGQKLEGRPFTKRAYVAFLRKPFSDEVFLNALNEALKRDRRKAS
jgi:hypothetical protein